jgi:hypothetical protein
VWVERKSRNIADLSGFTTATLCISGKKNEEPMSGFLRVMLYTKGNSRVQKNVCRTRQDPRFRNPPRSKKGFLRGSLICLQTLCVDFFIGRAYVYKTT